jgi:hypothetical protein
MEWNQSEVLALAMEKCATCGGYGMRPSRNDTTTACNCVLRSIFRRCFDRFKTSMIRKESILSRPYLEHTASPHGKLSWGRKDEEYAADFLLVVRRTLSPADYNLFNYHFLLGADWRLCCRKLKIDKGLFFHAIYRITAKLGRTFVELEPYALYPLHDYFYGEQRQTQARIIPIRKEHSLSSKVPLNKVA